MKTECPPCWISVPVPLDDRCQTSAANVTAAFPGTDLTGTMHIVTRQCDLIRYSIVYWQPVELTKNDDSILILRTIAAHHTSYAVLMKLQLL